MDFKKLNGLFNWPTHFLVPLVTFQRVIGGTHPKKGDPGLLASQQKVLPKRGELRGFPIFSNSRKGRRPSNGLFGTFKRFGAPKGFLNPLTGGVFYPRVFSNPRGPFFSGGVLVPPFLGSTQYSGFREGFSRLRAPLFLGQRAWAQLERVFRLRGPLSYRVFHPGGVCGGPSRACVLTPTLGWGGSPFGRGVPPF